MMASDLGEQLQAPTTDAASPWSPGSLAGNASSPVHSSAVLDGPAAAAGGGGGGRLSLFKLVMNVGVVGLLCVLGYVGNLLILLVLRRGWSRTSNTVFLQALAVFDSMFLTYALFYVVLRSAYLYAGGLQSYQAANPYIVALVLPFGWISQTCTIWTVMVIAIDRYVVASWPLRAALWCTPTYARRAVGAVFLAAVLFNAPRWPHAYYIAFHSNNQKVDNTFVSHLTFNNTFWDENQYKKVYHQSLSFIFLFLLPFTVMVILNILLVVTIKRSIRARHALTNGCGAAPRGAPGATNGAAEQGSGGNLNLSIMMVILISIFVVCELPDIIASILGAVDTDGDTDVYECYAVIKECLLVLNSALNFYLYCIFYSRFRSTLAHMLSCVNRNLATCPKPLVPVHPWNMKSVGSLHSIPRAPSQQTLRSNLTRNMAESTLSLAAVVNKENYTTKL